MAYRDDVQALNPDHLFPFDGDFVDIVGALLSTNGGMGTGGLPITEDATGSMLSNATGDDLTLATSTNINGSGERFTVSGWFLTTGIQLPPKSIYADGASTSTLKIVFGFGNSLMVEARNSTDGFLIQVFGPILQPNRVYHICVRFESDLFGNQVRLFVDGVEYTLANPIGAAPNGALSTGRSPAVFGVPATSEIGGVAVTQNASVNGNYAFWAFWGDDADAQLTDTEIREELFEKGALPGLTIATGSQASMQSALDLFASTARPDEPLNIRVEDVSGGGDLTLSASNITHDELASIHVQWMGTGTLTWENTNGSNASISSTPNGGTVNFVQSLPITVNAVQASDGVTPVEGARVRLLVDGGVVLEGLTNSSGQLTGNFTTIVGGTVTGVVRKGTTSPLFKTATLGGTVTSAGFTQTVFMVSDE